MLNIVLIAACLAFSIYWLLWRALPSTWFNYVVTTKGGKFVLDLLMFIGTTGFMIKLAGASMFAMSVGATAGVLGTMMVVVHSYIITRNINSMARAIEVVKTDTSKLAKKQTPAPTKPKNFTSDEDPDAQSAQTSARAVQVAFGRSAPQAAAG